MRIDLGGRTALVAGPGGALKGAVSGALAGNGARVVEATLDTAAKAIDGNPPYVLVYVDAGAETGPVEPAPALADVDRIAAIVRLAAGSAKRVVNLVSAAGLVPVRRAPVFSAAAASLVSLTRSLAMELGAAGVAVNGLAVGAFSDQEVTAAESLLTHAAVKRPAELAEITAALLFLADPVNTYTTGHILNVDGGWAAGYARNF